MINLYETGPFLRLTAKRHEENARRQCLGAPLGGAEPLSDEDARACRINLDKPNLFAKAWDYYAAKIARRQSGRSA